MQSLLRRARVDWQEKPPLVIAPMVKDRGKPPFVWTPLAENQRERRRFSAIKNPDIPTTI